MMTSIYMKNIISHMKKTVLSTCLVAASASISSAANVALEFSDTEDGFTTIPGVSSTDLVNDATLTAAQNNPGNGNFANLGILNDGAFGTGFGVNSANGTGLFRIQIDLGGLFDIDSINTFSVSDGNDRRSNQTFLVFGSALANPTAFDELSSDFESIATVILDSTDPAITTSGTFGASSITDIDGSFQTLLFVSEAPDGTEGTIFREIDVFGTAVPEPSSTALLGLGFLGLITRRRR